MNQSPLRAWKAALLVIGAFGCGGSSTGGGMPSTLPPAATPTPASSIGSPTPTPAPVTNPGASSCPLGKGTVDTQCNRTQPAFLSDVDAAIDQLVREKPQMFDTHDVAGPGEYKVKDIDGYIQGVVAIMQSKGFCAGYDLVELQVKNSNDFNDQYDILLGEGYIRRGLGSYRNTCSPAAFPLDPEDLIAQVRVGFYGFRCDDGIVVPRNGQGELPVGCTGFVTASPKNKNGDDVDSRIHGTQIQWRVEQDGNRVRVDDVNNTPFNKNLVALEPGPFGLCAMVRGVEGCLHGEVVPPTRVP